MLIREGLSEQGAGFAVKRKKGICEMENKDEKAYIYCFDTGYRGTEGRRFTD